MHNTDAINRCEASEDLSSICCSHSTLRRRIQVRALMSVVVQPLCTLATPDFPFSPSSPHLSDLTTNRQISRNDGQDRLWPY